MMLTAPIDGVAAAGASGCVGVMATADRGCAGVSRTGGIKAVKSMSAEMFIEWWRHMVSRIGHFLAQVDNSTSGRAYRNAVEALCGVLDQAYQTCMATAMLHPTNMRKLLAATLDDGRSGIRADDQTRWAAITASLQLNEEQKKQVLSLCKVFLRRSEHVMADRRQILAKLQSMCIAETLQVNECMAELEANLRTEQLAGIEFTGTVFKTVFSPLQLARAIVHSYPFYPDIHQMATALAVEKGGLSALQPFAAQQQPQGATAGAAASSFVAIKAGAQG